MADQRERSLGASAPINLGALAAHEIDKANRQSQSLQTMMFVWHCWLDITNRTGTGNAGKLRYSTLPRTELIPLFAHPVYNITAGAGGFSYGGQMGDMKASEDGNLVHGFGTYAAGGKSVNTPRSMLAHESRIFIEKNYGEKGPGAAGCLVLESLTAEDDAAKVEAIMLYEGVMKNTRPIGEGENSVRGVDVLIEDLPEWLRTEAPQMLDYILKNGVDYAPGVIAEKIKLGIATGHYRLEATARAKGKAFIKDLLRNVTVAVRLAVDKQRGILSITKGEIQKAKSHMPDSKQRPDFRDEFLLEQFYSFSMDTDVERAQRANQPLAASLERSAEVSNMTTQAMLDHNRMLLEEMKAMRAEVNALHSQLASLKTKQPAVA